MQRFKLFRGVRLCFRPDFPGIRPIARRVFTSNASSSTSRWTVLGITALLSGGIGYSLSAQSHIFDKYPSVSKYGSKEDFAAAVREFESTLDDKQISLKEEVLYSHGFSTNNHHAGLAHSVVVYPRSTEDVVKIVNIARKWLIPVVPYSGGTSLEGHTSGVSPWSD